MPVPCRLNRLSKNEMINLGFIENKNYVVFCKMTPAGGGSNTRAREAFPDFLY